MANRTFGFAENLKTYSEAWLQMTELVKHSENFLMIGQLQEALQNSFVKNFVESQLDLDVGQLMGKLRAYETMVEKMLNNSATEQISLLAQLMGNLSSCLLLNRFQPMESVEKLEAKARELMQQNNFLASKYCERKSQALGDTFPIISQEEYIVVPQSHKGSHGAEW
uniref:Uncharacterized protein n=1 Tax=Sphaerodactylus townsendi TaxID=933632 RepID=A0ACB8FU23_9SAUR